MPFWLYRACILFSLNGVNFDSDLFSNKKYTNLRFRIYFNKHKLNIQKGGE